MGVQIAALSVDAPSESARVASRHDLSFPILCDVDRTVTDAFGLRHETSNPAGEDIPIPAHVLIKPDGQIVWRFISGRVQERLTPDEVLDALAAHSQE
jgi:peroxiredoxin